MDGIDFQYVVALDTKTGRTVWKTDRTANWNDIESGGRPRGDGDLRKAYSTPLIVDLAGGKQMLSVGSKAASSYDPQTGHEIWKINHSGFSTASRPLFDGTNAIFVTGHGKAETLAVRATGHGDVTASNILWRVSRGSPRMSSPVQVGDLVFTAASSTVHRFTPSPPTPPRPGPRPSRWACGPSVTMSPRVVVTAGAVFWRAKGACAACWAANPPGDAAGPSVVVGALAALVIQRLVLGRADPLGAFCWDGRGLRSTFVACSAHQISQ